MDYTGYIYREFSSEELSEFYQKSDYEDYCNSLGVRENQYLFITQNGEVVDRYCFQKGKFRRVGFATLRSEYGGMTKPRNEEQRIAFDMLKDEESTIKLITGTWGSGKTMALVAAAVEAIEKGKFEKIYWIRNNVQVKDTDALGALPGDEIEKMLPYVMPMADHAGGIEGIKTMIENDTLEVIPLGFLRGRSIRNSIIISSEAENLTKEHIQLLIGRVDEGSNLWMDADLRQRDRVAFEKSKGLETMVDRLAGNKLFGYVHLVKSERSETAQLADLLND